ncbi:MAG: hypothetical protein C4329_12710 [Chitinophagaceae bacterium]
MKKHNIKKSTEKKPKKEVQKDYWDRIADDVATGYGADDLTTEEESDKEKTTGHDPTDHERGDA